MNPNYNWKKIFKNIIFANSIFYFAVIIISFSYSASSIYKTMVREILKTNSTILNLTRQNIDNQLMDIERHINNYTKEENVLEYINSENINTIQIIENQKLLKNLSTINSKISGVYLYKFSSGDVLSQDELCSATDAFDEEFVQKLKALDYDAWLGIRMKNSDTSAQKVVITYACTFPKKNAVIVLEIAENILYDAIIKYKDSKNGTFFICDSDGVVLSHMDTNALMTSMTNTELMQRIEKSRISSGTIEEMYDNLKSTITYNHSQHTGWYYINAIPNINFLKPITNNILPITVTAGLLYIISIAFTYFLIKNASKPIGGFVQSIVGSIVKHHSDEKIDESCADLKSIENVFLNMIYQQDQLKNNLKESYESVKSQLIMELMLGFSKDADKALSTLELLQSPLYSENFMVMIFEVCKKNEFIAEGKTAELSLICTTVKMEFERLINIETKGCAVNNVDGNVIAIISFNDSNENKNTIMTLSVADSIVKFTQKNFHISSWVSVGNMVKYISDISSSYSDAIYAMKYKLISGNDGILFVDDYKTDDQISWQDTLKNMENVVHRFAELSDDELGKSVCEIISNICKKRPTTDTIQQLALHFVMLVTARYPALSKGIKSKYTFSDTQNLLKKCTNEKQITELIYRTLLNMKHIITDGSTTTRNDVFVNRIIAYIDKNYSNCELSLNMIADKFHVSVPHLSRIFKESTSQCFTDYLIEKRMEKAKELLSNTNIKISEIASAVGYDNQTSFMRNFKKYTGFAPTVWKKDNINLSSN